MSSNTDFKALWNKQQTAIPELKELFIKTKKFNKINLYKLIFTNVLIILTSVFIGLIWANYQPQLISTKIGIILAILAMTLFLLVYNSTISLLTKKSFDMSSNQYLQQLLKLKQKQLFLQTTMLNIYFFLLSLGISLYIYEYVSRMSIVMAIISYGLIVIWIALNWFYLRPRAIQKQQTKINALINKFKKLNMQLEGEAF